MSTEKKKRLNIKFSDYVKKQMVKEYGVDFEKLQSDLKSREAVVKNLESIIANSNYGISNPLA